MRKCTVIKKIFIRSCMFLRWFNATFDLSILETYWCSGFRPDEKLYSLFFSTKDKVWVRKKRRKTGLAVCNAAITMQTYIFSRNAERIFLEYEKIKIKTAGKSKILCLERTFYRPVQQYQIQYTCITISCSRDGPFNIYVSERKRSKENEERKKHRR